MSVDVDYESFKKRQLQNPKIKAAYDALEAEYNIQLAMMRAEIQSGLTPEELSERTGITQTEINELANGGADPKLSVLQRLAAGLAVQRGMTLIKVKADDNNRLDVLKIAELFRAHVVDVQQSTLIFEITGDDDKVTAFTRLLSPYGIKEVIRTGLIALERGDSTIYEQCEEREYYGKNLL